LGNGGTQAFREFALVQHAKPTLCVEDSSGEQDMVGQNRDAVWKHLRGSMVLHALHPSERQRRLGQSSRNVQSTCCCDYSDCFHTIYSIQYISIQTMPLLTLHCKPSAVPHIGDPRALTMPVNSSMLTFMYNSSSPSCPNRVYHHVQLYPLTVTVENGSISLSNSMYSPPSKNLTHIRHAPHWLRS
jgi:hypothetical protein